MSNDMKKEKKGKTWVKWIAVITSGLVVGALAAVIFIAVKTGTNKKSGAMKSGVESELDASYTDNAEKTIETENISKNMKVSSSDVSDIVDSVLPSVVSIECIVETTYDPFSELFDFGMDDFGFDMPKQKVEGKASGTGFIIGQNGDELLIATNNHVVDGAKSLTVEFIDGTKADAVVKGTDAEYDVAVLSVDLSDLSDDTVKAIKIATIGNSDDMQVGSMVIAIGNALGYGQSVTVGYVSALDRDVTTQDNRTMKLMQTDAVINHGNSGGPLLNIYGEVIGITNSKYGTNSSGRAESMGFAIPITKVVPIINELMNRVELSPSEVGYLGIEGKEVSDSYAKAFGMPKGLYVYSVERDSAADKAGLMPGDIITEIDGRTISTMEELKNVLSFKKYDTEVEVKYSTMGRTGYEEKSVTVKLGKKSYFNKSNNN